MARDSDDNSTSSAALWLLSRTLHFVTDCLQSEAAAKKYLLDYFATKFADNPLEWSYERCRIDAPETTRPPQMRKQHLDPIQPGSPDPGTIQRFFWEGQDIEGARYEIDWQAGDATYEGPLIEIERYPSSSGWRVGPMFNGSWRIKIRIELIRVNTTPIIANLRRRGFLAPDINTAPASPSPSPTIAPEPAQEKEERTTAPKPAESAPKQSEEKSTTKTTKTIVCNAMEDSRPVRGERGYARKLWETHFEQAGKIELHTIETLVSAHRKEFEIDPPKGGKPPKIISRRKRR